jgi:hypothetical protein
MTRLRFALAFALSACAAPIEQPDAAPDAASRPDAQSDAQRDAGPMDSGAIVDTGVGPIDSGVIVDTGVPPRDTGVGDTGLPACTLDPRNCGQCGRVCGVGALSGRPACAEVATGRWDCVNNCGGFGEGCGLPGGGTVCCASGCGPIDTGCR